MAKDSRWLRLNVDWDDSPWLFTLSAESQLAWIKLLCYVKALGVVGKVRALEPLIASRKWSIGEEAVSKMLQAALNDGALTVVDGAWVIVNWATYQGKDETNADRQKRYRERKSQVQEPEKVTDRNAVTLSRDRDRDRDRDRATSPNGAVAPAVAESPLLKTAEKILPILQEVPGFKRAKNSTLEHLAQVMEKLPNIPGESWIEIAEECRDAYIEKPAFGTNSVFAMPPASGLREFVQKAIKPRLADSKSANKAQLGIVTDARKGPPKRVIS